MTLAVDVLAILISILGFSISRTYAAQLKRDSLHTMLTLMGIALAAASSSS
jgi:hypothetical protein